MDTFVLEARGLSKVFNGFAAVSDVDLRVRAGTIHALIGPNGAGKSTIFHLLTKFLAPTAGTIYFKGQDITAEDPADIAQRGLVRSFQISSTFPHLSLLENVHLALLGGMGTVLGPVVGAFIMVGISTYLASLGGWITMLQGMIFIVCVLTFRNGIVGTILQRSRASVAMPLQGGEARGAPLVRTTSDTVKGKP